MLKIKSVKSPTVFFGVFHVNSVRGNTQNFVDDGADTLGERIVSIVRSLSEDVNKNTSAVESIRQAVDDLGVLANYIRITVDGDQPCIELGESENDFKVRITNTEIHFADGTVIPTRITRQMMIIEKAMMRDGLQFGDDEETGISGVWILKRRSNGNLGLMWKEVNG